MIDKSSRSSASTNNDGVGEGAAAPTTEVVPKALHAGDMASATSLNGDFLFSGLLQLNAIDTLAGLKRQALSLRSEIEERRVQRRKFVQASIERAMKRQKAQKRRQSWTAAIKAADADAEIRDFDQATLALKDQLERLEIEAERLRLAIEVGVVVIFGRHCVRYDVSNSRTRVVLKLSEIEE